MRGGNLTLDWGFNWEGMSERCIEALVLAQQEAEFLKAHWVGTEHVLIGLLSGRNLGAQILAEHRIDVALVRATLEKFRTRGDTALMRRFSWRVKRAVELAFEEAARIECPFVNTDHLYVGMLCQPDSTASRILSDLQAPLPEIVSRLSEPHGVSGETDLLLAGDLLEQLRVADNVPELEQIDTAPATQSGEGVLNDAGMLPFQEASAARSPGITSAPISLDRFMEVLDELSRALQSAHRTVSAARPQPPVHLDIPEVGDDEWPVVDEEAYQIAGLVRQILSQAVARGAQRVVLVPCELALRLEYHMENGHSDMFEIPAILRTVIPFKVMRMASLNPMEKGRELEGRLTFRFRGRSHRFRVRSEPILKGLRVEVSRVEAG